VKSTATTVQTKEKHCALVVFLSIHIKAFMAANVVTMDVEMTVFTKVLVNCLFTRSFCIRFLITPELTGKTQFNTYVLVVVAAFDINSS